ncbi:hypothetical protein AMATHDRAFT_2374 [Amanita thiersii Skay4041]|uniref:Cyclin N-terminal domain-containing protein n=1 Tax=Amanita thiersii Skay4041 TaxID=703135 RepID=A0A2A9NS04_9AGAR|nr:hypothetical protein AMATHDRAFT_2374 [Amanita thiersii Skay4041]
MPVVPPAIPHDIPRKSVNIPNAPRPRSYQPIPPSSAQQSQIQPLPKDPFYGHEPIARLCARFITFLFTCPEHPPSSHNQQPKLPHFIAYALHRTKLHPAVVFAGLVLLQRLKARFPSAKGSSGHRLFISAYMIASKVICDDTYSNKSWAIVAQNLFTLREINQMEREMCSYLDWELTVDSETLQRFERAVRKDFSLQQDNYPSYPVEMVSKRAIRAVTSTTATPVPEPNSTTSPIPMFSQQRNASPSKPNSKPQSRSSSVTWSSSPGSSDPDTPPASYSNSTSPASSVSPATPTSVEDYNPKIQGADVSPHFSITEMQPSIQMKEKVFAVAIPAVW